MQHDGSEGGAAHAAVGNADHVLDAGTRQLQRDRQVTCLGHAGCAFGPDVLEHQDIVGRDVEVVPVDSARQVFGVFEHDGAAFMLHEAGVRRRLLDDRPARRQVAVQHGDAALRINGIAERTNDILREARAGEFHFFA